MYKELEVRKRLPKHHPMQRDQMDRVALDQLVPGNYLVRQMEQTIGSLEKLSMLSFAAMILK
ncbi:hypothetical protein A4244_10740 [Bacillus badius]|nr:hypothetical protein A4244_10740 [Bacillus badius]KZR58513.1 hypothetical protein A3781_16595 [Bacillus badius]OCS82551.1 hypothetical protein A6M11_10755 [Bacillus badius]OVE50789.1 hypothetical protein B1A98_15270 [Bacillus badius]